MRLVFAVFILSLPVVLMVPTEAPNVKQNAVKRSEISLKSAVISLFQGLKHRIPYLAFVQKLAFCGTCELVTAALKVYLKYNVSQEIVVTLLRESCKLLRLSTPEVCDGVINNFKDEFFYVLRLSTLNAPQICGTLFPKECESRGAINWTVPIPDRNGTSPEPYPSPKEGAPTMRVLHISDTHVDPLYLEGSLANCNEPLCCQNGNASKEKQVAAGRYGSFQYCDIPMTTLEKMLHDIYCTKNVLYAVWTGDLVPHDYWNRSRDKNLDIINRTTRVLAEKLKGIRVFPALGNHEGEPTDSFPQPYVGGDYNISWLYEAVANEWSMWLPESALRTLKSGGYYAVEVFPGLKILSMNMNYCNRFNWWLFVNNTDPAEELSWLVRQLQESEEKKEKVHIIGHIPPGMKHCHHAWVNNYHRIITRFEDTVRSQFFGHTHKDEVQLFYDPENKTRALAVAYMGPSVTTYHSGNPAYRIYTVDGNYTNSTWAVLNHTTYTMNLTEANESPEKEPTWSLEYSAKEAYNMSSLHPQEWDRVLQHMENDIDLFKTFYGYYSQHNPLQPPCDDACRKKLLCEQKNSSTADWWFC